MLKTIAILRESKTDTGGREIENRVILTPAQISEIKNRCRDVGLFVEAGAGAKIDFQDNDYEKAGAVICTHLEALTKQLIIGVKETKPADFPKLRDNIFLSFQHFAQSQERTKTALKTRATFLALETMEIIKSGQSFFPCLAPMSEAAAKVIARHADEYALLTKKIITSGLPETGLHGLKVAVIGGGMAGRTAAEEFSERGCEVSILEKNPAREKELADYFKTNAIRFPKVTVLLYSPQTLRDVLRGAFFLVSAMYSSGRKTEKLITFDLLKTMLSGSCVYPIDIDQGGGIEGVAETSILEPFDLPVIEGTEVHYFAPPNLPSLGARTTSEALGSVILPYVIELINKGLDKAADDDPVIASGINIKEGKIVHPGLASVFPQLFVS
jgi:alanine dehydrogenase